MIDPTFGFPLSDISESKILNFLFVSFGICGFMLYKEVHFEVNFCTVKGMG